MAEVVSEFASGVTFSESDLEDVAHQLLAKAGEHRIWVFKGEMGAGKTTLIKSIAKLLGVIEIVQSPTFSIVNEYDFPKGKMYHFDFYRIKNEAEAFDIGAEEYFDSGNYCFIEWPEKIPSVLLDNFFEVCITAVTDDVRMLEFNNHE
jgi:tRNA threonylcarbamoyladenosine biosynthesis protein TsaE